MFRSLTLRRQLVLCIGVVQIAALALCALVLVFNARKAVEVEVSAGERSARALVLSALGSTLLTNPPQDALTILADMLVEPRHVDLLLIDMRNGVLPVRQSATEEGSFAAPDWFRAMVSPGVRQTRIPVQLGGRTYGYIAMSTAPRDEIEEVWRDVSGLFWVFLLTCVVSLAALTLLVDKTLRPVKALRIAMARVKEGDLSSRVIGSASADLAPIIDGFDALSESLEKSDKERRTLNQRIIEVGDAERRSIAMELHDEFGPCLFGLKVKAGSISRLARDADLPALSEDADQILSIVGQIQASNARLLTTLRPMAIGQLSLIDAIGDLFDAFRKTHPGVTWNVNLPEVLPDTQEMLDLTVYRFFQEGATNALRHGHPHRITATITIVGTQSLPKLSLSIEDDGLGMSEPQTDGRGLTAMRDRIAAIGGQLVITKTDSGGTRLDALLPMHQVKAEPVQPMEAAS